MLTICSDEKACTTTDCDEDDKASVKKAANSIPHPQKEKQTSSKTESDIRKVTTWAHLASCLVLFIKCRSHDGVISWDKFSLQFQKLRARRRRRQRGYKNSSSSSGSENKMASDDEEDSDLSEGFALFLSWMMVTIKE